MSAGATLVELVAVAIGGGAGAAGRHQLDTYLKSRRGWAPLWSLAVVNLLGTIALGVVLGFVLQHPGALQQPEALQPSGGAASALGKSFNGDSPLSILFPLIGVGVAGGFTTFSTAMVEVFTQPQPARRIVGVAAMLLACCAVFLPAIWGGAALAGA
ncbi:CrcB family protein [Corynebacterium macclintockiae]|uniref:CrcB family protein n=1 Tax=Corynebacterium macclintockiae TaxID=2913501 RepID=UPI003EBDA8B0